jgi:hypothetical protein
MLKDALRSLKQLSLYMQGDYASVLDAHLHVNATKLQLLSLKEGNGQSLGKFVCSFQDSGTFKGVTIKKNDSDEAEFVKLRNQFFHALHDNISARFPANGMMLDAGVLVQASWPEDPLKRALYGEREVASLCRQLSVTGDEAAQIVA